MDVSPLSMTEEERAVLTKFIGHSVEAYIHEEYRDEDTGDPLWDLKHGRCPALECTDNHYTCKVYEARPSPCRIHTCHIWQDIERWASGDRNVVNNPLAGFQTAEEVWTWITAYGAAILRSEVRGIVQTEGDFHNVEDYHPALVQITGATAFPAVIQRAG